MPNRLYTWKPQKADARDYPFEKMVALKNLKVGANPSHAYNRPWCSSVKDQGQQGCCTGHAWTGLLEYNENKFGFWMPYRDLSRAFVYWNERVIEQTTDQDSGAELRDGAKAVNQYGVALEGDFPYHDTDFTTKPSAAIFTSSLKNTIHSYYSLDGATGAITLTNLKTCLANGQCFVFGFQVYDFFESDQMAQTGVLQVPAATENLLGGHAVMGCGYSDYYQAILVKNSWGLGWGLKGALDGYFTIPYGYISNPNLASDFWTVVKDV